jgi:uncharacterized membrane protein
MVKVGGIWSRVPSIILVLAIVGALGMLGYAIASPKAGEKFTEFYILGLDGKAIDYPEELIVGEEGKVKVGDNQKVEFLLYKQGWNGVYQRLHLWVDVK